MAFTIEHGTNHCQHTISDGQLNKLKKSDSFDRIPVGKDCKSIKKQRDSLFRLLFNPVSNHGQKISAFLTLKAMQVSGSKPDFLIKPVAYSGGCSTTLQIIMQNEAGKTPRVYQTVILSGQYIQSIGTKDECLKLSNMNLTDLNPESITWSNCDVNHTDWREVRLDRNTFSQVNGEGFNLANALLKFCNISDCKLTKLILTFAKADDLDVKNSDLTGADLSKGSFERAVFSHVNLSGANLSGATFTGATFNDCTFNTDTNWENARLQGVTTNDAGLQTLVLKASSLQKGEPQHLSGLLAICDPLLRSASRNSLAPSSNSRNSQTSIGAFHFSTGAHLTPSRGATGMTSSQSHNSLSMTRFSSDQGITLSSQIRNSTSQLPTAS